MNDKYHGFIRTLHWLMFVLFTIMFVLGFVMVEFKESQPWAMYNFHKSTGVLLFGLVIIRLLARWITDVPPLAAEMSATNRRISKSVIHFMYLLMVILPISGYALSNVAGYQVSFYGLELPQIFPKNEEWESIPEMVHEYGAYIFLGFIGLHLLGVITHHIKKIEILRRIT
ncbi:cytochrome b [Candidatus Marithrix sp. Canyon 246]|uniref:cytochrome b n=1 Tax=Candidatus Marithrix sp. Canyon 246 TaxID=1827136 RepID=UPI000849FAC8|nr:cytochrome b [Candidatus Marithrix sp. Canyon 246]